MRFSGSRELEVELYYHGDQWLRVSDDEPIPEALAKFVQSKAEWQDEPASIMFDMTWSGSYSPAYISGAPEDCYPEEYECEMDWDVPELVIGPFEGADPRRFEVPEEVRNDKEVSAWFDALVDAEEIDSSDMYEEV